MISIVSCSIDGYITFHPLALAYVVYLSRHTSQLIEFRTQFHNDLIHETLIPSSAFRFILIFAMSSSPEESSSHDNFNSTVVPRCLGPACSPVRKDDYEPGLTFIATTSARRRVFYASLSFASLFSTTMVLRVTDFKTRFALLLTVSVLSLFLSVSLPTFATFDIIRMHFANTGATGGFDELRVSISCLLASH